MAGCAILFGGLDIFYNLLDTLQMLSYLKYVNTQFPYNLQSFFNLFGFA
jgi:proprotein convertase subtilisin/kexin type 5